MDVNVIVGYFNFLSHSTNLEHDSLEQSTSIFTYLEFTDISSSL